MAASRPALSAVTPNASVATAGGGANKASALLSPDFAFRPLDPSEYIYAPNNVYSLN